MNCLLRSMLGIPVLYYGDEIGFDAAADRARYTVSERGRGGATQRSGSAERHTLPDVGYVI